MTNQQDKSREAFEKWYAERKTSDVSDTDMFGNLARQAWQASRAAFAAELVEKLDARIYGGDARHGVYNAGINDAIDIVKGIDQ